MTYERWRVGSDWPATPTRGDELTHEQVLDVLDQMGDYYQGAVDSLPETPIPEHAEAGGSS